MKTKLMALLALLSVVMGLVACGRTTAPEPTAIPAPVATATIEPTPPQPGYTPIWEKASCPFKLPSGQVEGRTVECGYLIVPEDRRAPSGRTIRLAVAIFHPPDGASEHDPIVYLVGGPGASALEFLYLSFDAVFAPVFAANRDLILFDQRGVGFSQPVLDCNQAYDLGLELLDHELDGKRLTEEEMDNLLGEAYVACQRDLSAVADLSAYNTVASAADVNDLRIALGYQQVNLWGGSYGTRLALGVMRDYPAGLRSVVLDSVYPPDMDLYLATPANLDRAFNLLCTACAADKSCNAAYPNLRQVFFATAERLNKNPFATKITNPLTGISYDTLLTGDTLFGLVFQLLYETKVLPVLPQLIYDASRNNFETINRIYGALLAQGTISSRGMMFSVQCNEELSFSTLEQFEAVLLDYPDLAPFLRDTILGGVAYHMCTFWGAGQAAAVENQPVTSDVPTLIMQGEHDPVTPPAWGQHAAQTLKNSYFYLYPGVGHGASVVDCPREMMLAFLKDPQTAPDKACIAAMSGLSFVVPGADMLAVKMEPFASQAKGIQGVAPVGWQEAGPGAYVRGSTALDETSLVMDVAPITAQELFSYLAKRLGFAPGLERVAREKVGHFTWDFYKLAVQGLSLDLALAEAQGKTYMVLLVATPDERDALYGQVFRPAVEALAPG